MDLHTLNKWRMEQFKKNNHSSINDDKDFACMSKDSLKKCQKNAFLISDSDEDDITSSEVVPLKPSAPPKGGGVNLYDLTILIPNSDVTSNLGRKRKRTSPNLTKRVRPSNGTIKRLRSSRRCGPPVRTVVSPSSSPDNHLPKNIIINDQSDLNNTGTNEPEIDKSDSDLSLFEISVDYSNSDEQNHHDKEGSTGKYNSVCSTEEITPLVDDGVQKDSITQETKGDKSPISISNTLVTQPVDSMVSNESCEEVDEKIPIVSKKGKQPANKSRKIFAKRSKKTTPNKERNNELVLDSPNDSIKLSETKRETNPQLYMTGIREMTQPNTLPMEKVGQSSKPIISTVIIEHDKMEYAALGFIAGIGVTVLAQTPSRQRIPGRPRSKPRCYRLSTDSPIESSPRYSSRTRGEANRVSTPLISWRVPNSTPITARHRGLDTRRSSQHEDDDDDVVVLTSHEKSRQEQEDLEFARRLQAQFDKEIESHASRSSADQIPHPVSPEEVDLTRSTPPLTGRTGRLLQALGGSPTLVHDLATHTRNPDRNELANVESRIDILRQLALQSDYLSDGVVSQVLGMNSTDEHNSPELSSLLAGIRSTPRRQRVRSRINNQGSSEGDEIMGPILGTVGINDTDDFTYESLLELSELIGDARRVGLTKQQINLLPEREKQLESITGAECHICMSEFAAGDRIRTLPCFHEYHSMCIDVWLKVNSTCPVCRENILNYR